MGGPCTCSHPFSPWAPWSTGRKPSQGRPPRCVWGPAAMRGLGAAGNAHTQPWGWAGKSACEQLPGDGCGDGGGPGGPGAGGVALDRRGSSTSHLPGSRGLGLTWSVCWELLQTHCVAMEFLAKASLRQGWTLAGQLPGLGGSLPWPNAPPLCKAVPSHPNGTGDRPGSSQDEPPWSAPIPQAFQSHGGHSCHSHEPSRHLRVCGCVSPSRTLLCRPRTSVVLYCNSRLREELGRRRKFAHFRGLPAQPARGKPARPPTSWLSQDGPKEIASSCGDRLRPQEIASSWGDSLRSQEIASSCGDRLASALATLSYY